MREDEVGDRRRRAPMRKVPGRGRRESAGYRVEDRAAVVVRIRRALWLENAR